MGAGGELQDNGHAHPENLGLKLSRGELRETLRTAVVLRKLYGRCDKQVALRRPGRRQQSRQSLAQEAPSNPEVQIVHHVAGDGQVLEIRPAAGVQGETLGVLVDPGQAENRSVPDALTERLSFTDISLFHSDG